MPVLPIEQIRQVVDDLYRKDSRRVFATLIRLIGDFDLAEEALHDAFTAAVEQWSRDGVPQNPRAWLVSTGRFRAIDTIRRRTKFDASLTDLAQRLNQSAEPGDSADDTVQDDRLRLIFTCCHPALSHSTQVALTLREVCGLKTEEIASAFLTTPATIAQRIVRGKSKIRDAGIPYQIPSHKDLPERIESVLSVIYLVFNEGYSASTGSQLTRSDLSGEAIRLGRLLVELLPDAEAQGLLGLMLLQESRRLARTSAEGDIILLEDQDRSLWNADYVREGRELVAQALNSRDYGVYTLQASIAAVHAAAPHPAATDWSEILSWYDILLQAQPSPIVQLNRAVALAMRDGPEKGLELIDQIIASGELGTYHFAHAARADLCRRLGRLAEARESYEQALLHAKLAPERRFLENRLQQLVP